MELVNADVSTPPGSEKRREEPAEEVETSPTRSGPPSETSSQEWDQLTDPGSQAAPEGCPQQSHGGNERARATRKHRSESRRPNRLRGALDLQTELAGLITEVEVGNNVLLDEVLEVFAPLGAADEAVLLRVPACDDEGTQRGPAVSVQVS